MQLYFTILVNRIETKHNLKQISLSALLITAITLVKSASIFLVTIEANDKTKQKIKDNVLF
jgi:hypothetical protein